MRSQKTVVLGSLPSYGRLYLENIPIYLDCVLLQRGLQQVVPHSAQMFC